MLAGVILHPVHVVARRTSPQVSTQSGRPARHDRGGPALHRPPRPLVLAERGKPGTQDLLEFAHTSMRCIFRAGRASLPSFALLLYRPRRLSSNVRHQPPRVSAVGCMPLLCCCYAL
jgi:hypothetical protein